MAPAVISSSIADDANQNQHPQEAAELTELKTCPCCSDPASGLGILPLTFTEIDQAQRLSRYNNGGSDPTAFSGKRMHTELMNLGGAQESKNFYDPASPRIGKWSEEEIAFRDEMVPHFVEGSLPLPNGVKLIDFLSNMLKSKPSRLTKKMKHAKLSTRHFHLDCGYIPDTNRAKELSRLELAFVNGISDAVERSEIKFHMQKEWRDHLAERLTYLRISFDADDWLRSVDVMDRRVTLAKSRNRMVRRRVMMGKAMEKDTSNPTPGIFIDQQKSDDCTDVDFELLASALEANDSEDADLSALYSSMARGTDATPATVHEVSDSSRSPSAEPIPQAPFRSALLPSLGSSEGPNFRFAAPFLAKIAEYIERHRVPFEHIDIWVPRAYPDPVLDPTGATAPEQSLLGSGSTVNNVAGEGGRKERLCFAGSASVGVQILPENEVTPGRLPAPPIYPQSRPITHAVPLSSDEIYHLSLFGSYSEKFSFSSGCGLPGRVYESAVPAWEQFIANAPSHLFERRGGAMQFGIKTALGLPLRSPNVGRIVLVLYSKQNREKNDELVARMVRDFQSLGPCPRWKLMVDMGNPPSSSAPSNFQQLVARPTGVKQATGANEKSGRISSLISLLGENMPSDQSTPLGQQIHNIMSLRLVLLQVNRTPEDEQLVESILTLFDSYIQAGRSRSDITLMLARDFAFHSRQHQQHVQLRPPMPLNNHQGVAAPMPRRVTMIPSMQHLSIGASIQQQEPYYQLEHMNHGQSSTESTVADGIYPLSNSKNQHFETSPKTNMDKISQPSTVLNRGQSPASTNSMTKRNYSNSDFQASPKLSASLSRLQGIDHCSIPLSEPPASLH
eukprot:CAMPEP_0183752546 /NCGR_PEP_ID=MMETSP0739-20130205/2414_1 /TAXON_ID=385413 /ORGANISM="Thalassiosira miniscula, Strain CCMP1093" /LENGTH=844 /DNA_ID=CAMNT_0025988927 /DNA_START=210 /DNA_END=2744 /DNA_ORIENTATION=-